MKDILTYFIYFLEIIFEKIDWNQEFEYLTELFSFDKSSICYNHQGN